MTTASEPNAAPQESDVDTESAQSPPLSDHDRRLARWTAMGLTAALLGSIGGVLIELLFS